MMRASVVVTRLRLGNRDTLALMGAPPKAFVAAALVVVALVVGLALLFLFGHARRPTLNKEVPSRPASPTVPEIVKKDCQRLVDGQLLFDPSQMMRQGQPQLVFARLSRNPGVNIAEGLEGGQFVIVKESVSCKVSMRLDSEEPGGFAIEKLPSDREDEQFLEPNKFSQWDWRVTPRKHGTLHLLLYVTPLLYVEGVGEALKEFRQPPRVITVTPDYWYESGAFLKENWVIISGLLTAIVIPLLLWFRAQIIDWFRKRARKKRRLILPTNE
jgi:hypothetical protein